MKKEEFLKGCANWDNHRFLLWPALEATKGLVVEFGSIFKNHRLSFLSLSV